MIKTVKNVFITMMCSLFLLSSVNAKTVTMTSEKFIETSLASIPKAKSIWLTAEDKSIIANILNHKLNLIRIRYWQLNNQTVWILNEIGKEKPITIGVHITDKQISSLKVLTYRESRGDEVLHEFFTEQFNAAKLTDDNGLTNHIDGITGATMSVRALTKVASIALLLNNKVLTL